MTGDQIPDDETCPLCGQPFDHKRMSRGPLDSRSGYRDDARVCKQSRAARSDMHYIHLPEVFEQ